MSEWRRDVTSCSDWIITSSHREKVVILDVRYFRFDIFNIWWWQMYLKRILELSFVKNFNEDKKIWRWWNCFCEDVCLPLLNKTFYKTFEEDEDYKRLEKQTGDRKVSLLLILLLRQLIIYQKQFIKWTFCQCLIANCNLVSFV